MGDNIAVFSHHRSGTHFLMRALAMNSSYTDVPHFLFDVNLGCDIWNPNEFHLVFQKLKSEKLDAIAKSHYEADFFQPFLPLVLEGFQIIYIVRRPEDCLKSYFDFTNKLQWLEAPDCENVNDFIKAAPCGSALRWQMHQYETMAHRWEAHVEGWLTLASEYDRIHVITYEQLYSNYDQSMKKLLFALNLPQSDDIQAPEKTGFFPGQGGTHQGVYTEASLGWLRDLTTDTYQQAVDQSL